MAWVRDTNAWIEVCLHPEVAGLIVSLPYIGYVDPLVRNKSGIMSYRKLDGWGGQRRQGCKAWNPRSWGDDGNRSCIVSCRHGIGSGRG